MKYSLFGGLFQEAKNYGDVDMYIAERGWQEWMDDYGADKIADILSTIYKLAHSSVKEMRESEGLSRAEFCRIYLKKVRTVEEWDSGNNPVSESERMLMAYTFFNGRTFDEPN